MKWDSAARVLRPLLTFATALVLVAVLLALLGYPFGEVVSALATGSLGSPSAVRTSLGFAMPLLLIAWGIVVSFRAGMFNLGGQGQFFVGALCSVAAGLAMGGMPSFVVVPLALLLGSIAGALWSAACGLMLIAWRANEILTTLMANFVAAGVLSWAAAGPLHNSVDPTAISRRLEENLRLSDATGWSTAIAAIVVAVGALTWALIDRTSFGLQAEMLGRNPEAARWMGVPTTRVTLGVFGIAGAFAGLAGAVVAFGASGAVSADMSPNIGFTAVLVATLGLLTVPGTAVAGVVFGGLSAAIVHLALATPVPASAVAVFQGTIMVLVTCRVASSGGWRRRPRVVVAAERSDPPSSSVETRTGVI